jgi:hypothetical protein
MYTKKACGSFSYDKSQMLALALPPRYEVIAPSPIALNAYQLKGLNPSKKNNECLRVEKVLAKAIQEYEKARKGFGKRTPSRKGHLKQQALPLQRLSWRWIEHGTLHVSDFVTMK